MRAHATRASLPEGDAKVRAVEEMFDLIAPRYDLLNRVLTFGLDVRWRRVAVRSLGLAPGAVVVDLACGTGDLCREVAVQGHRPVGVDRSAGMLAAARTSAPLVRGDALRLPLADARADAVVCGFSLRNFVALGPVFAECARVLRPGGQLCMSDITVDEADLPPEVLTHPAAWAG
jgi:demethylmenaquinone methyltransferase/2-methoxy-6-polyprenyl-1,4-benzoquinol methylase